MSAHAIAHDSYNLSSNQGRTNLKAMVHEYGEPQNLKLIGESIPSPKPGEVRIKVRYAGVGWADIMARRGGYPLAPRPPLSLGYDFVGVVDELASDVEGLCVGDHVVGLNPDYGCYAQYLCLPSELLVSYPDHLDAAKVCALSLNYLTAYCMLFKMAKVEASQSILVHAAAGGVGTALLQLAQNAGINVIGTASKGKHLQVKELGATPIDYQAKDFVKELQVLYPQGVDAAFDPIGGKHLSRSTRAVKRGGTVISYGFSGGQFGGLPKMLFGMMRLHILNLQPNQKRVKLCALPSEVKKHNAWYRDALSQLIGMYERGEIDPTICAIVSLREAHKAHALLESGATTGKVVLDCEV